MSFRCFLFPACLAALLLHAGQTLAVVAQTGTKTYCTPTQKCWPSTATWSQFNSTISGRLIKVVPWQDPCYASPDGYQPAACENVRVNYFDGNTRSSFAGAAQIDNWASCTTNAGLVGDCSLTASTQGQLSLTPETSHQCKLGRLSPYAVAVSDADDVQKALAFAKQYNIKIVIKNTGHEYLGRSTAPDSLMIWTHNLKSLQYTDNFQGTGKNAVTMGSGVNAGDAYEFAAAHDRTIALGAYGSVGVGGGFVMGGGHGPLGPTYGLAVDNILQFTVVTADGQLRTANANTNSDLFWALRGGGGGTFGVVLDVTHAVHPQTPVISLVYNVTWSPLVTTPQAQQAALADFIAHMALYQSNWTRKGWAGYTFVNEPFTTFSQFLPSSDVVSAKQDMQGIVDYLTTNTNLVAVPVAFFTPIPTFEAWRQALLNSGAGNTPVAYSERLASRLIPYSAFAKPSSQQQLAKDITQAYVDNGNSASIGSDEAYRAGDTLMIFSTGAKPAAWGGPSGSDTGVNTAWRSSLWEIIIDSAWTNQMSQKSRNVLAQQTSTAANRLRKYGTGTYFSESDVLEPNWQTAFFGTNYNKLVQIKKKYDPTNVFIVWKGIGFAGQENQAAFACYQQA